MRRRVAHGAELGRAELEVTGPHAQVPWGCFSMHDPLLR